MTYRLAKGKELLDSILNMRFLRKSVFLIAILIILLKAFLSTILGKTSLATLKHGIL